MTVKIECAICGSREHVIQSHLSKAHPEVSLEEYQSRFPTAPILSEAAKMHASKIRVSKIEEAAATETTTATAPAVKPEEITGGFKRTVGKLNEVFGLGKAPLAFNARGDVIPVDTFEASEEFSIFVPDKDKNYVFPIPLLKVGLMAITLNTPLYLWGHAGTGKSTIIEQIAAHTGRPWIRVQHTRNTEESHILGQWLVKNGQTEFELGPLPFAMKHGLIYCADEYDFAMPAVMALYQPVLEGKPLVIKDADRDNRIIKPHPLFRICATGNTNGTGDETGLYAGTMIQNAANYERFGVVAEVKYVDREIEVVILINQGGVPKEVATKMVDFATRARTAFADGKLGLPPSPRAMINACKSGNACGSYSDGINLSYINRLNRTDQIAANELVKRMGWE